MEPLSSFDGLKTLLVRTKSGCEDRPGLDEKLLWGSVQSNDCWSRGRHLLAINRAEMRGVMHQPTAVFFFHCCVPAPQTYS